MGVIRINSSNNSDEQVENLKNDSKVMRFELSENDARILLKACQRYRATIPSYLQIKKNEVKFIDRLIKILKG